MFSFANYFNKDFIYYRGNMFNETVNLPYGLQIDTTLIIIQVHTRTYNISDM